MNSYGIFKMGALGISPDSYAEVDLGPNGPLAVRESPDNICSMILVDGMDVGASSIASCLLYKGISNIELRTLLIVDLAAVIDRWDEDCFKAIQSTVGELKAISIMSESQLEDWWNARLGTSAQEDKEKVADLKIGAKMWLEAYAAGKTMKTPRELGIREAGRNWWEELTGAFGFGTETTTEALPGGGTKTTTETSDEIIETITIPDASAPGGKKITVSRKPKVLNTKAKLVLGAAVIGGLYWYYKSRK